MARKRKSDKGACRVPGCDRPAASRGICKAHGVALYTKPDSPRGKEAAFHALPSTRRAGKAAAGFGRARANRAGRTGRRGRGGDGERAPAARRPEETCAEDAAEAAEAALLDGVDDDLLAGATELGAAAGCVRLRVPEGLAFVSPATGRVAVLTASGSIIPGRLALADGDADAPPRPSVTEALCELARRLGGRAADVEAGWLIAVGEHLLALDRAGRIGPARIHLESAP